MLSKAAVEGAAETHGRGNFYWRCGVRKGKLHGGGDILSDLQECVGWGRGGMGVGSEGSSRASQRPHLHTGY